MTEKRLIIDEDYNIVDTVTNNMLKVTIGRNEVYINRFNTYK